MEINLKIGWNDLSDSCREKIKQIHKLMKNEKAKVNVEYPNIKDLIEKSLRKNDGIESYSYFNDGDSGYSIRRDVDGDLNASTDRIYVAPSNTSASTGTTTSSN